MYVRITMRRNISEESQLAEYYFRDTPFIIGTILASEPINSRFYDGVTRISVPEIAELISKWHDIFMSLTGQQGLSKAEQISVAVESEYIMPIFAERSFGFVCSTLEMKQIVNKVKMYLYSMDQLKQTMPEDFFEKLKKALMEFVCKMEAAPFRSALPVPDEKARDISLLAWRSRLDEWGETYCTTYPASFRLLDSSVRDNLARYEFSFIRENSEFPIKFHIPDIIRSSKFADAWCEDLGDLVKKGYFPQAILFDVCERGTLDGFVRQYKISTRPDGYKLNNEKYDQAINTWSRYSNRTLLEARTKEEVSDELSNLL